MVPLQRVINGSTAPQPQPPPHDAALTAAGAARALPRRAAAAGGLDAAGGAADVSNRVALLVAERAARLAAHELVARAALVAVGVADLGRQEARELVSDACSGGDGVRGSAAEFAVAAPVPSSRQGPHALWQSLLLTAASPVAQRPARPAGARAAPTWPPVQHSLPQRVPVQLRVGRGRRQACGLVGGGAAGA